MLGGWGCLLAQGIANEVVGEVGTLVKGVQRGGLIRGVMGYLKREDGSVEAEANEGRGHDTEGRR